MSNPPRFVPPHLMPNFERQVPEGDSIQRLVCRDCGHIHYQNPKIVVGAVVTHQGKILLCRRAIEPRYGYWTIPAGYMEEGETPEAGARREAMEEACARIRLDALLGVYTVVHAAQVQLIYRASLDGDAFAPGPESLETALFGFSEIPWTELAFPTVKWALNHFREVEGKSEFPPFVNPGAALGDQL